MTFKGVPTQTLERFFLVRTATTDLDASNWTDVEKDVMRAHRWWTVSELLSTAETVFPPRFGYWVERFLKHGTNGPEQIPL